jgi:hypothetical protein
VFREEYDRHYRPGLVLHTGRDIEWLTPGRARGTVVELAVTVRQAVPGEAPLCVQWRARCHGNAGIPGGVGNVESVSYRF